MNDYNEMMMDLGWCDITMPPIIPSVGDRIILINVPKDLRNLDLYKLIYLSQLNGIGDYEYLKSYGFTVDDNTWRRNSERAGGFSGYVPYKDEYFSVSGSGHACNVSDLKFIGNKPAPFWKFKDGLKRSGNGILFWESVNYFELDFNNLK